MKRNPFYKTLQALALLLLALATMASAATGLDTDPDTQELYVNMPETGTKTVEITADDIANGLTTFKVYDDGGKDGDYGKAYGTLALTAPEGSVILVDGSCTLKYATVKIDDENGSRYGPYGSTNRVENTGSVSYRSSDNTVNIVFSSSYENQTSSGLDLTVTVFPPRNIVVNNPATGGTAESDKTKAISDETVTLTATPSDGYLLSEVVLKDDGGKNLEWNVDIDWYSNTATFSMPNSNVAVTPVFTNDLSAEGGLYVNMPKTDTKNIAVPANVKSFKVYDDGGKYGNYSKGVDGYLALTAPAGRKFRITGSVNAFSYSRLVVYDGNSDANQIFSKYSDASVSVLSSDNIVTFRFYTGSNQDTESGLDLTVEVVTGINVNNTKGGNVSADKKTAVEGETVTLTITPSDGYVYGSLEVKDADNNSVAVDVSGNTATFTMPASNVTVIPTWTEKTVNIVSVAGGSVTADNELATADETVTLTVTPDEGYVLSGISVVDADNNPVTVEGVEWFSNTATFTMPSSKVTITPAWTDDLTGLSVNMLVTGLKSITIPAGVTSFKVYDDGGKDGAFTKGSGSYLEIKVPEGKSIRITGSTSMDYNDAVKVYEGDHNSKKLIVSVKGNSDIGTLFSVGNEVYVYFYNYYNAYQYSGLDLQVDVVDASVVSIATKNGKKTAVINGSFNGTDALNIKEKTEVDFVEFNRVFSTNGNGYSTIVLPFDYYIEIDNSLAGASSVLEFTGMTTRNGKPAVGMSYVWCQLSVENALKAAAAETENPNDYEHCNTDTKTYNRQLKAYTPYIIQMYSEEILFNKTGFTLEPTPASSEARIGEWAFRGTTAKKVWTKDETKNGNVWAYAGTLQDGVAEYIGKFVKLGAGAYTPPLRAYLVKDSEDSDPSPQFVAASKNAYAAAKFAKANSSAGVETASVSDNLDVVIVSRDSNGNEHTTVIGTFNRSTGEFKMLRDFDLKGRKVNGVNKARGAYYGKKVLKK